MTREELIAYDKWLTRRKWMTGEIISPEKAADIYLAEHPLPPAEGAEAIVKKYEDEYDFKFHWVQRDRVIRMMREFAAQQQPTAEGAEEILESIVESLGEPINIHNHIFEIRPYTVEHKTEWWIFHKEVGSGEPLAQWLQKFATLHAQRLAEKMVEEKAVGFADWLSKLQPSQKVSVWSKNGEHSGLFTMDNEQLYKKYLKSIEP